jgi:simple sugar transport system permease protein
LGAFTCALCGAYLPAAAPAVFVLPASILAAAAGGAALGALAGWLKARCEVHEVISTIMLNFVVRAGMVGLGALFFLRETVHTRSILPAASLARLSRFVPAFAGSAANLGLFLGLIAVAGVTWLLARTRLGFRVRAVGAQPQVAAAAGISVAQTRVIAFAIAGALAGLGGANFVLGYKGYYEDGFSGGVGFVGIAVAVLGGAGPWALIASALLFGTLAQGALTVNAACPKEIIDVMQATMILAAAASARSERRS